MHPEVETAVSERLAQLRAQVQQQAMQIAHLTTMVKALVVLADPERGGPIVITRAQLEAVETAEVAFRDVEGGIELELP